jgi:hypothetical protein
MEENKTVEQTTNATDGAKGSEGSNETQKDTTTTTEATSEKVETGDEEFTDTKEKAKENPSIKDKPNDDLAKRNKEQAQLRREKEAQEKAQKDVEHKARLRAIKEERDGINPYTNEKMESDDDIEFYLEQKEMSKQGLDPLNTLDYKKFINKKVEKQTNDKAKEDFRQKDLSDFTEKYPDVKFNDLQNDEEFMDYADGKLGTKLLSEIYGNYLKKQEKLNAQIEAKAKDMFEKRMAKKESSAGAIDKTTTPEPKPYSKMSDAEFAKVLEKAKRGELSKR